MSPFKQHLPFLCWWFVVGMTLSACPVFAQQLPELFHYADSLEDRPANLLKHSSFLIDHSGSLNQEAILQADMLRQFQPFEDYLFIKEHCTDWQHQDCPNYWVISRLSNELGAAVSLAYSVGFWHLDHQTTWILREDSLSEIHFAGFRTPLRLLGPEIQIYTKVLNRRKVSISFTMRGQDTVTLLSKIEHRSSDAFSLGPRIATNQFMARLSLQEVRVHRLRILFQAMYLILMLFYLGNYALNRQPEYLLFVGYNLCMALILLQIGNLQALVLPNSPDLLYRFLHIAQALLPFMYAGFLYYFLEIPRSLPRLVPLFRLMMGLSLAITLGVLLFQFLSADWKMVDNLLNSFLLFSLLPLLLFIAFASLRRRKEFLYFLLASAALFLGGCAYFLLIGTRLTNSSEFALQAGIFAEVLIFAVGLGDKSRQANFERARLEAIDQIKTRLYTNLTHEFRTPLTVILGMVNQIEGHEKERRLIHRNSENILRLINQLLDLSKLDAGAMRLDLVQGDVVTYLRYLTQSFESLASDNELQLHFDAEPPELYMAFDEAKWQHIIYNLLSNALKYTPPGGKVVVSLRRLDDRHPPLLQLSVQDNGLGISPEALPHIFDRYFQAEYIGEQRSTGTGIGLTLTKELIHFMQGSLEVQSELGKGSTFQVLLPIHQAPDAPRQELSEPSGLKNSPEKSTRAAVQPTPQDLPQLLLIEDNPDVRAYIQLLLQGQYVVQIAKDGQAGIELALEQIPDIILTDVMMPRKNGFEVCRTLKNDVRTSHIPIIMLTAKATQGDKVTGLEQGADAYLMKPFDKSELLIRLRKLIELRRTLQQKYQGTALLQTDRIETPTIEDTFLLNLREAVEKHMAQPENTLDLIGRELGLSSMQLYRKLKALADTTPSLFVRSVRLEAAAKLLRNTDLNVSEIAYEVGFNDPAYFSRAFKENFNQTPSEFKNN